MTGQPVRSDGAPSGRTWKPDSTVYQGARPANVTVDGLPLGPAPSLRLARHSPTGFQRGYGGSGPAQLALAILLNFTGDERLALERYQPFKWEFVAGFGVYWRLEGATIRQWLEAEELAERALAQEE